MMQLQLHPHPRAPAPTAPAPLAAGEFEAGVHDARCHPAHRDRWAHRLFGGRVVCLQCAKATLGAGAAGAPWGSKADEFRGEHRKLVVLDGLGRLLAEEPAFAAFAVRDHPRLSAALVLGALGSAGTGPHAPAVAAGALGLAELAGEAPGGGPLRRELAQGAWRELLELAGEGAALPEPLLGLLADLRGDPGFKDAADAAAGEAGSHLLLALGTVIAAPDASAAGKASAAGILGAVLGPRETVAGSVSAWHR